MHHASESNSKVVSDRRRFIPSSSEQDTRTYLRSLQMLRSVECGLESTLG